MRLPCITDDALQKPEITLPMIRNNSFSLIEVAKMRIADIYN
jgi:hypothetical protein